MLRNILIIILLLSFGSLQSQPPGFKKVIDDKNFRKQLAAASNSTQTIKSDFEQVKNLSLLDEKIFSKGSFRFKKENKVRMEYTSPFNYLLVINGDKVSIRDQQKANTFSARSNKLFTIINRVIIDCVQGTVLDNTDFTPELFSNEKSFLVKMTPVKKELKEFFDHILVYIDPHDFSVQKFDMIEPAGDNTLITFINKEINAAVPESDFVIK